MDYDEFDIIVMTREDYNKLSKIENEYILLKNKINMQNINNKILEHYLNKLENENNLLKKNIDKFEKNENNPNTNLNTNLNTNNNNDNNDDNNNQLKFPANNCLNFYWCKHKSSNIISTCKRFFCFTTEYNYEHNYEYLQNDKNN